jgi:hypothetical protein
VRGRENEYLKDTLMDGELVLDIDVHKVVYNTKRGKIMMN